MPQTAPYGTWDSPIQPDDFAVGSTTLDTALPNVRFPSIAVVYTDTPQKKNGKLYLLEIRPTEEGRGAIIEYTDGQGRDVLPKEYSALSQVHEYGGGSIVVRESDGHLVFTDLKTKGVFDLDPSTGDVKPIIDADEKVYFADFDCHPVDEKWLLAIKEDHHPPTIDQFENTVVVMDTASKAVHTIAKGCDFYSYPRFSRDGKKVSWIQWNHPNMPWDTTELWVADFEGARVSNAKAIAHEAKASATQPIWADDGTLFFADDRTGWWQLYRYSNDKVEHIALKGLEEAEFGHPDWWLSSQTYAPLAKDKLLAFYSKDGYKRLILVNPEDYTWKDLSCPIIEVSFCVMKAINASSVAVIGATKSQPSSLFTIDIDNACQPHLLKSSSSTTLPEAFAPTAQLIKFARTRSSKGGHAYALFYPPTNPNYTGPTDKLPPLIVAAHGGPTWQEQPGLYLRDAFWTTRGYALVQINYIGSAGFGKHFISLLKSEWGLGDIQDGVSCIDHLSSLNLINPKKVGVTGHSAGGFYTMQSLGLFPEVYTCGIAESGISDLSVVSLSPIPDQFKEIISPSFYNRVLITINLL